jgi:hypothetical protein
MSDQEVQAPTSIPQAPLAGLLQGYQYGQNVQAGKQAASDASDARDQQQANFEAQMAAQKANAQADRDQALKIFQQKIEQENNFHNDAQKEAQTGAILNMFDRFYSSGSGYAPSLLRAIHAYDLANPNNPYSHLPTVPIEGATLHAPVYESDNVHPNNGPLPPGTPPFSPIPGLPGQNPDGIATLRATGPVNPTGGTPMADSPLARIQQTAQGGGYAQLPAVPMQPPGQAQPPAQTPQVQAPSLPPQALQQMPQAQAQPQQPPAQTPPAPQAQAPTGGMPALNPLASVMNAPAQTPAVPQMGAAMPMQAQAPVQPMAPPANTPPTLTAPQETQLINQIASKAAAAPPYPVPPPDKDSSPDYQIKWQAGKDKYDADIQAAQHAQTVAEAQSRLTEAEIAYKQIQTQQLVDEAKQNNLMAGIEKAGKLTEIDLKKASIAQISSQTKLAQDKFAWDQKQAGIDNQIKQAMASAANGEKYAAIHAKALEVANTKSTQLTHFVQTENTNLQKLQQQASELEVQMKIPASYWEPNGGGSKTVPNGQYGEKPNPAYTTWLTAHTPVTTPDGKGTGFAGNMQLHMFHTQIQASQARLKDFNSQLDTTSAYKKALVPGASKSDVMAAKATGDKAASTPASVAPPGKKIPVKTAPKTTAKPSSKPLVNTPDFTVPGG